MSFCKKGRFVKRKRQLRKWISARCLLAVTSWPEIQERPVHKIALSHIRRSSPRADRSVRGERSKVFDKAERRQRESFAQRGDVQPRSFLWRIYNSRLGGVGSFFKQSTYVFCPSNFREIAQLFFVRISNTQNDRPAYKK